LIMIAEPFNHALTRDGIILASIIGGLLTGCLHEASLQSGEAAESRDRSGFVNQLGILQVIPSFDRGQRAMIGHVTLQRGNRDIAEVNSVVVSSIG
jgi:hypothetical protein